MVTALAHSPVRALQLPKAQFDRIVADEPRYYQYFARLAFDRYAALLRVFAEVRGPRAGSVACGDGSPRWRSVRQQDRPQAAPVSLAVSQADLARMVGVSRQTLNVLLGRLDQERLIEIGFRRIRVLDPARLADPRDELDPEPKAGAAVRARATGAMPRPGSERIA